MSFSSVQFSRLDVSNSWRPHGLQDARPPCPSPTLESTQAHVHRVSDAIQPSHPLSSPSPPAINLSQHQGLFKWVSSSHQVAKVLRSFSFIISPSNEHPGLISFRMDWLALLAVQGTLKSLLQHHSSESFRHISSFLLFVYPFWNFPQTLQYCQNWLVTSFPSNLLHCLYFLPLWKYSNMNLKAWRSPFHFFHCRYPGFRAQFY